MAPLASMAPKARALMARTVHVKIHPTARTFNERREVLRVLERFGEYHPTHPVHNAFLAMFTTENAAAEMIKASPIRYHLTPEEPHSNESTASPQIPPSSVAEPAKTTAQSSSDQTLKAPPADPQIENRPQDAQNYEPIHAENQTESAHQPSQEHAARAANVFELRISQTAFDHQVHIQDQPLYGPYKPVDPSLSYIASCLRERVPESLWSAGLIDWETEKIKWRRDMVFEQAEGFNFTDDRSTAWRIAERDRKRKEKALPAVMQNLAWVAERYQATDGGEGSNSNEK